HRSLSAAYAAAELFAARSVHAPNLGSAGNRQRHAVSAIERRFERQRHYAQQSHRPAFQRFQRRPVYGQLQLQFTATVRSASFYELVWFQRRLYLVEI